MTPPPTEVRPPTVLPLLLLLSALGVLLSYAALGVVHLNDATNVDIPSGANIGLAYYLNHGLLYPEVYDGEAYGGTRYMPLFFTLQAGLARLTGEYLVAGKLLALLAAAAAGVVLFIALRRLDCPAALALALAALALADRVGFNAGTTIRADLLAAVWQLAALAVVSKRLASANVLVAAGLCVLGVLTKASALWGPLAILVYAFRRERRAGLLFAACWLGTLIVAAALLHFGAAGRMLANFRVAGEPPGTMLLLLAKSPFRMLLFIAVDSPALLLLTPLLVVELFRAWGQQRLTVYHHGLFFCVPLLLVTFADAGTVSNHLIDLVLLTVVLMGCLWKSLGPWRGLGEGGPALVLLAALWGLWTMWAATLGHATRDLLTHLLSSGGSLSQPYKPLAGVIADDEAVLTEDTLIAVARGRRPIVLDAYMLAYLERRNPEAVRALAERIRRREFAHLVLRARPDLDDADDRNYYRIHLGPTVAAAIRDAYRFERMVEGRNVFAPR
jgi:hypothetical protein